MTDELRRKRPPVLQRMGPLAPDHPALEETCPGCRKRIAEGDYVTLVVIGPGDDIVERAKARSGNFYTAVCVVAHWGCATGKLDNME